MKRIYIFVILVSIILISGCVKKIAELSVVGTKKFDLSMQEFEKVGENITGESITPIIFIIPAGKSPTIDEAVQNALQKAKGDIMTDATVYNNFWYIPYIYGQTIIEVKGTVWKLKNKN